MIKSRRVLLGFFLLLSVTTFVRGADYAAWPKVIKNLKGELTICQPQPESIIGCLCTGALISYSIVVRSFE